MKEITKKNNNKRCYICEDKYKKCEINEIAIKKSHLCIDCLFHWNIKRGRIAGV